MNRKKNLIIGNDELHSIAMNILLLKKDFQIELVSDIVIAIENIKLNHFVIIFIKIQFLEFNRFELVKFIRNNPELNMALVIAIYISNYYYD